MSDITIDVYLRHRRRELEAQIAQETEKAKAPEMAIRLDELASVPSSNAHQTPFEIIISVGPLRRPDAPKPSLRYRNPGATTDIVSLLHAAPGTDIDSVITRIHEKYKGQGAKRDSLGKMIRRLIREGFAYRDGTRLYLTEKCTSAWTASPMYRTS